jgi:hypothetical protein
MHRNVNQPQKYKPIWFVTLIAIFLALTACNTNSSPISEQSEFSHLATVTISTKDTQAEIEKMYDGKVLAFRPEAKFAILGFTVSQAQLSTLAVSPNIKVRAPSTSFKKSTSVWGTGGSAWGGGASAWGGGWSAWGGGWSAWGGGSSSVPTLPGENRLLWANMRLPQAQAIANNYGQTIRVAVIDTGLDLSHPMFSGHLMSTTTWLDYVDADTTPQEVAGTFYGHGTGVGGLILQVAPKATLLPLRVLGPDGTGSIANVIAAINAAIAAKVDIINLSLMTDTDIPELKLIIETAAQAGIYVVMAAGNDALNSVYYPAAYATTSIYKSMLLSVGSVSASDILSTFSNYGTGLEFLAPGEQVFSSYPDSRIAYFTGTSFAAPIVSGAVALAKGDTTSTNFKSIESYLSQGAAAVSGYKRIDPANLLRLIPGFRAHNALLVTGSTTLTSDEKIVQSTLTTMGYIVNIKDDDVVVGTDAFTNDIVLIAASTSPTSINTKFRDVNRPVIIFDDGHFVNMQMTGVNTKTSISSGLASRLTSIAISGSIHPMNTGLSGILTVQSISTSMVWGTPSSGAVSIASTSTSSQKTIFGYDRNATMVGMNAPDRRVGFYLGTGASSWTAQGKRLFEAAVTWTASGN